MPTLQLTTDEVSDEPKAYLWMAGRALQCYLRAFFLLARISISGQKSLRVRDQCHSPTLPIFIWACPTQPLASVDENSIRFDSKTMNVKGFKAQIMLSNRFFAKLHESLFCNTDRRFAPPGC